MDERATLDPSGKSAFDCAFSIGNERNADNPHLRHKSATASSRKHFCWLLGHQDKDVQIFDGLLTWTTQECIHCGKQKPVFDLFWGRRN